MIYLVNLQIVSPHCSQLQTEMKKLTKLFPQFAKQISFLLILLLFPMVSLLSQTNLIGNSDFEFGTTGWTTWGDAVLSLSSDSHSGSKAALVSNRNESWHAAVYDITSSLVNGESYTLGAWVKITDAATDFRATIALNVDGNSTYTSYLSTASPVIGSYVYYTETFTVAGTGNLVSANLYFETAANAGVYSNYLIDDVTLYGQSNNPDPVPDDRGFKEIKSTMSVGVCVTEGPKTYFNNSTAKALVLKNYGTVNVQCYPAWGRWDETSKFVYHVDDFSSKVKEMKANGMVVTAHMLLGWDQYFPAWYKNNDFSADTLEMFMNTWLDAIISTNGNDTLVDIWNVVNEAINWDGQGHYWPLSASNHNNACELQRMGYEPDASGLTGTQHVNDTHPIYIRKAFEYARTLTDKKLELRETSCEFPTDQKYNAFYQLAVHLKNVGAPVDVIGLQTHLDLDKNYDWVGYTNTIKRFRKLGYEVNIPEVDVGDTQKSWSDDKAEQQKLQYYKMVTAAIKGGASDFQTWGFIDNTSSSGWRTGESALIYSTSLQPKPAFYGIQEALIDMSNILFWEMDAPVNDTMPDVMTYNNYGIVHNFATPQIVSGYKNKAIKFDGVDDYMLSDVLSESIMENLTFSCYFKTSSNNPAIIADLVKEDGTGILIGMNADGKVYLNAGHAGQTEDLISSAALNDNSWHFVALKRDSSKYSLYIDKASPVAWGDWNMDTIVRLSVGAMADGTNPFDGTIDEVKLFDTSIEDASFMRDMAPVGPFNLNYTKSNMNLTLRWSDLSSNEDGFVLERKVGDQPWEEAFALGPNVIFQRDTFRLYNTIYSYRVKCFNKFGPSNYSNMLTITSPLDPATGIAELPAEDVRDLILVYPNPAVNEITVVSGKKASMKLYDSLGKMVLEKNNLSGTEKIDISRFPKGFYFLKVNSESKISTIKLIKN